MVYMFSLFLFFPPVPGTRVLATGGASSNVDILQVREQNMCHMGSCWLDSLFLHFSCWHVSILLSQQHLLSSISWASLLAECWQAAGYCWYTVYVHLPEVSCESNSIRPLCVSWRSSAVFWLWFTINGLRPPLTCFPIHLCCCLTEKKRKRRHGARVGGEHWLYSSSV